MPETLVFEDFGALSGEQRVSFDPFARPIPGYYDAAVPAGTMGGRATELCFEHVVSESVAESFF